MAGWARDEVRFDETDGLKPFAASLAAVLVVASLILVLIRRSESN